MDTRTSKRNQEEKAETETPPSKKTKPVDPPDGSPSGTIETTTVMSFKDDEKLSKLLSEDDFKEGQGVAARSFLEHSIGKIRQERRDNSEMWQDLCSILRGPDRLSARLDETSTFTRMAEQNYGFNETMAHELDVQALEARLREVEKWHQDEKVRDAYLAPLLAIIQSSGTGKSRLMNVVRNNYQKEGSRTILLNDKPFDESRRSLIEEDFDEVYIVNKNDTLADQRQSFVGFVKEQCKHCSEKKNGCVRLFFDEAQHLAHNGGFLIRVLRWMTREKKFIVDGSDNHCKLTVVLAGTNSALANFFPEEEQQSNQSRSVEATGGHYEKGTVPFPPFFMLRTMGCLSLPTRPSNNEEECPAEAESEDASEPNPSEYESMIQYSRPLFAKLHKDGRFHAGKEYEAAKKIVLGHTDWKNHNRSCLSVLGTRIQMGPTSAPIVSDLVSKGYAHLTYYEHGGVEGIPNRASFAFLPDPVCARIAMCLMDNEFKFTPNGTISNSSKSEPELHGATKKEMAKMMGLIFSQGVCQPAKGDFGEVASALYLLFCGDELRKQKCAMYKEFAVDLSQWMELVQNQGRARQESLKDNGESFWVNCIQFFRQDLRLTLKEMADETFLKGLYVKACAIYCANNIEAIDLVVPCCYRQDDETLRYLLAAFSVKNYGHMSTGEATIFLHESWTKLTKAGINQGLCVLVIVGQDRPSSNVSAESYKEAAIKSMKSEDEQFVEALKKSTSDISNALVPCFVCIHGDNFGIDGALKSGSTLKDYQESEVFVNHSDLLHGSFSGIGINTKGDLSRFTGRYRKAAKDLFTDIVHRKYDYENEKAKEKQKRTEKGGKKKKKNRK
mmetsp:Transcript_59428/g.145433  ORF Transcript_59428/g.145433 Transcript_59428/m.145433 type:complete len:841 (-) Transcript_59428:573-3095(-)